jgi:predicted acetyltransferase
MIVNSDGSYVNQLKRLWKKVFNDNERYIELFFGRKYRDEETLLYVEGGSVKSMLFFPRYEIKAYGRVYRAGYICGAATIPEYRGRGLMTMLLDRAFDVMSERGDTFSVLIPGEKELYAFYSKYGYSGFFKRGMSIYRGQSFNKKKGAGIFLVKLEDAERIYPLYMEIISKHPVAVMQSMQSYKTVLDMHEIYGDAYLIINGKGEDAGYLFCEYIKRDKTLWVKEIMAKADILSDAAKALGDIYLPGKIIFEGIYGGTIPFSSVKTTGMLKKLKGSCNISGLAKEYPYMNMMLD